MPKYLLKQNKWLLEEEIIGKEGHGNEYVLSVDNMTEHLRTCKLEQWILTFT